MTTNTAETETLTDYQISRLREFAMLSAEFTEYQISCLREFGMLSKEFWTLPYRERVAAFAAVPGRTPEEVAQFEWEEYKIDFAPTSVGRK